MYITCKRRCKLFIYWGGSLFFLNLTQVRSCTYAMYVHRHILVFFANNTLSPSRPSLNATLLLPCHLTTTL